MSPLTALSAARRRRTTLPAALAALALAAVGTAGAHATGQSAAPAEPVVCEIAVTELRGAVSFEARVVAEQATAGTYRLAISRAGSGNRAMIQQSGDFRAGPGRPAILGSATLGGDPAAYRAELEVRADGRRLSCSEARVTPEL